DAARPRGGPGPDTLRDRRGGRGTEPAGHHGCRGGGGHLARRNPRPAAPGHRLLDRRVAGPLRTRGPRRRARLLPTERQHGDGRGPGIRRGDRRRRPARDPGGAAYAVGGQGGGYRQRFLQQGCRDQAGHQDPAPGCAATACRCCRRTGAGHHPRLAGRQWGSRGDHRSRQFIPDSRPAGLGGGRSEGAPRTL
ncbi:Crossover junction endodeoxyribonuclease RuvC (EC 3.1.22.4), partial [Arthrobacter sp. DR-2P]